MAQMHHFLVRHAHRSLQQLKSRFLWRAIGHASALLFSRPFLEWQPPARSRRQARRNQQPLLTQAIREALQGRADGHFNPMVECLEPRLLLSALLVKNAATGAAITNPTNLVNVNGTLFFTASDGSEIALWKELSGTSTATLVKDVAPAAATVSDLGSADNTLYLTVSNGASTALWSSDGTAANTSAIKTFQQLGGSDSIGADTAYSSIAAPMNGVLYFAANDGVTGMELWRTDGSVSGTYLVDDLASGSASSNPCSLIVFKGELLFSAQVGSSSKLYQTNGTSSGTQLLSTTLVSWYSPILSPTIVGDQLYFTATNDLTTGGSGQLWKTDGTSAGTSLVTTFSATGSVSNILITHVSNGNHQLYLGVVYNDGYGDDPYDYGTQVWTVDPVSQKAEKLVDVYDGWDYGLFQVGGFTTLADGNVFFSLTNTYGDSQIWTTDGTTAGTQQITTNPNFSPGYSAASDPYENSSVYDPFWYFRTANFVAEGNYWFIAVELIG